MGEEKMAGDANGWGKMEELEKGISSQVEEREWRRWEWRRQAGLSLYQKIMIALAIAVVLFLRYGGLVYAYPTPTPSIKVDGVPQYVLDYAPLVWLDTGEAYFPSDIHNQVENTQPHINYTPVDNVPDPLTLHNLDALNSFGEDGMNVYLTSKADVTTEPKWLVGVVPDLNGKTKNATSCAIIVNDHGSGLVDAYYTYFYAYNLGNTVLFRELGDHIGDWEHNMIRFENGEPKAVWYSQHANGEAFTYNAVEKHGLRPISYSAKGSHANYAIAGIHDHTIPDLNLPAGLLLDFCSKGTLWDPTLNTYFYNYHVETDSFESIDGAPIGAMTYKGKWGDEQYPDDDERQPSPFFGFRKFVGGPTGPWDKQLNRTQVCPENGIPCIVRDFLQY